MRYIPIICLIAILSACISEKRDQSNASDYYKEKHRPQFHFSPQANWMNDPNGMFHYKGEYHLFYQYYPDSNVWGPMHWGHAVSKDLISWEHLPIALYPDSLGYIFSGSAVVDWKNTSGLGSIDNPPLVAIYTYHDPISREAGAVDYQSQGIAYSLDNGRSWIKYKKNPVLPNPGILDFRDPKVSWHEASQKWIMALAVLDHISFYSSSNLISWEKESDFGFEWGSFAGVWECPDLFEMEVQGSDEKKWVLFVSINSGGPQGGSATQYFVGDFDGKSFTLDESFKMDLRPKINSNTDSEVFEDFESGYGNWVATGEAFGKGPANNAINDQKEVEGKVGTYFINSYNGGDKSTGILSSPPFEIKQRYINFKIGGGNDFTTIYAGLYIDDKLVRRSMGNNSEKLKNTSWQVEEFIGKKAQIKIIDNHTTIMGHILVDQIEFSEEPAPSQDQAVWLDYGADNYAGVTWSDIPEEDGRRLFLGWMSNWEYAQIVPTYIWRSAMTLPRELSLNKTEAGYRVHSEVVKEFDNYLSEGINIQNSHSLTDSTYLLEGEINGDFEIEFSNDLDEKVTISLKNDELIFDRSKSGKTDFSVEFIKKHIVSLGKINPQTIQIYVDVASFEIFVNNGILSMTEIVFPNTPYNKISINGMLKEKKLRNIKRIWTKRKKQ